MSWWPFSRREPAKLIVGHVHYIKTPSPDRLSKPLEMARSMGRDDLVKRLEELRP